ncbi:MAG: hypothetical protein ACRDQ5_17295 [Sciscionella sp.]
MIAVEGAEVYAREHVVRVVTCWGFGCLADRCERVAAELVSRAVDAKSSAEPVPDDIESREKPPPTLVGVRVCLLDRHVLVEVWDSDQSSPLPREDEFLDDHLAVVNEISRWSWYRCANSAGKVIWTEVHLPQPRPSEAYEAGESLPQRVAGSFMIPDPVEPIVPPRDLDLLKKVLDGLHSLDFVGVRDDL